MSVPTTQSSPSDNISPIWGPFRGPQHAASVLGDFIDRGPGPTVGICWAVNGSLYPLRHAHYDNGGFGETVVVEWKPVPAAPRGPPPHHGLWNRVNGWLHRYFEEQGRLALQQGQSQLAMGKAFDDAIGSAIQRSPLLQRAFNEHGADTLGVALDVVAVGLTIGFVAGPLGALAFAGGLVLLVADGTAWGLEMADNDHAAEIVKEDPTLVLLRWTAIIASIPDMAVGLYHVAAETPEAVRTLSELSRERAASSMRVSARASGDAARTGQLANDAVDPMTRSRYAAYARKYADIAERAQQRATDEAQALHREIRRKLTETGLHEVAPRLTVPPSLYLMGKDELNPENDDIVARTIRSLGFHIVSANRNEKR